MDGKSSVAERVLNRRRRKREAPDTVVYIRVPEGPSSKKKAKGGSFMDNAELVVISSSESESESGSEDDSSSNSGFRECSASASTHNNQDGSSSVAADEEEVIVVEEEEEDIVYIDVKAEDEARVSDLSCFSSESERDDDGDFEAYKVSSDDDGDFEAYKVSSDGGEEDEGSDYEAEPKSPEKELPFNSEKKKKMKKENDVGGCETSCRVKRKRIMNDDDTDPYKELRAEKGFDVGEEGSESEMDNLWAEIDRDLLSSHSCSHDSNRGIENDETHANLDQESENDETHANHEEASENDETHATGEDESVDEMDYLWAEMNCSLALSQMGGTCALDTKRGNKNGETHANQEEANENDETHATEEDESADEMDYLWAEMNRSLALSQIGDTCSLVAKRGNENDETRANQATLCDHDFRLDEEIGLRCRLCFHLEIEINDYIQPMDKFALECWGNRRSYGEEGMDGFGGTTFEASNSNPWEYAQGTVWDLIPGIRKDMFEHQREGFEFIWRNLAGTIRLDELKGTCRPKHKVGCIVSHGPGTGKTKLALTFLQSFLAKFGSCKPVIIAPAGMLLTWEGEFRKWNIGVPFHNINNLDLSENERMLGMDKVQQRKLRLGKLRCWKEKKSVLGISYSLYEKLAGESAIVRKKGSKEREEMRKILVELPTLLVLDEGHTPRNKRSQIWQALSKAQAQRLIILSGTPFQNNFEELCNIISLVRPRLARAIPASLKKSSKKKQIGNKRDGEIKKLKDLISPFVHNKGGILENNLPGLRSCVVGFNPTDLQKGLLVKIQSNRNNFDFEHKESLVAVHPSLLLDCRLSKEEESSIDVDTLQSLALNPSEGAKTRFLMEFIQMCNALGEKVLVFSQFIGPLKFIKKQLLSLFGWWEGREVLLMHGKLLPKQRQALINSFNDPTHKSRVLIASIKACAEGISLIGASRVVLLDVVWNPSVVRQAISRAYRLGQKRVVYSYHLITTGTTEWEKYGKQAEKDRIAEMVFTSRCSSTGSCDGDKVWKDDVLDELVTNEKLKDLFEKVIYHSKESNLVESEKQRKFF